MASIATNERLSLPSELKPVKAMAPGPRAMSYISWCGMAYETAPCGHTRGKCRSIRNAQTAVRRRFDRGYAKHQRKLRWLMPYCTRTVSGALLQANDNRMGSPQSARLRLFLAKFSALSRPCRAP